MATLFSTITADPPWHMAGGGKSVRGAQKHYDLLKTPDIPGVIRGSGLFNPAENAHLYLWTTNNYLPDGLWVMEQLGFRYVSNIVWTKNAYGIGHYFRGQHELCLFGVRGKGLDVCTLRHDIPSVIRAPRRAHSQKPDCFYRLVEARSKGPFLELFARNTRPGWVSWGHGVPPIKAKGSTNLGEP